MRHGQETFWVFMLLTLIIGGGAAIMMGRSLAQNWRSGWMPSSSLTGALALGVRFLHFALFQEPLLTSLDYAVDALT